MPYGPKDAPKHDRKANTPRRRRMWSKVFNNALLRGEPESTAFAYAGGAVKKDHERKGRKRLN